MTKVLNTLTYADATLNILTAAASDPNTAPCVSRTLRELSAKGDNGDLEAPIASFDTLREKIVATHVVTLSAEYHDAEHVLAVEERIARYLAAAGFSATVVQLGRLAALFHDAGHPGTRYREDTVGVSHPELSNEEYAAALAVEELMSHLNATQLLWIYGMITATSFGQKRGGDPVTNAVLDARPHLVRAYGPVTLPQKLLHFADVNGTDTDDAFGAYMSGGLKLAVEMNGGTPPIWDGEKLSGFAKSQLGFLRYIKFQFGEVRSAFVDEATKERCETRLNEMDARTQALIGVATSDDLARVKSIATAFGFTLKA